MSESIFLSVIIPAYNEEGRIKGTLASLQEFLNGTTYAYEVLVISDGSTDTTHQIVHAIAQDWSQLKLISNSVNQGKGAVVRQGILSAQGEYILFSDADNATPIDQIGKLLQHIGQYPVVFGSRYCPGGVVHVAQAKHRIILSRVSNLLVRWLLLPGIYDTQCGFKLFQSQPAKQIFGLSQINRFGFDFEVLAIAKHLGYDFKEIGVEWNNDPNSKVRAGKEALRTLCDLLKVKWNLLKGKYQ